MTAASACGLRSAAVAIASQPWPPAAGSPELRQALNDQPFFESTAHEGVAAQVFPRLATVCC